MKLLEESDDDLVDFNDKTPFTIMFGPDKCGAGKVYITFKCLKNNLRTKVIFNLKKRLQIPFYFPVHKSSNW